MNTNDVKVGQEVTIKTGRHGHVRFYGWDYKHTVVTRITKTRIFVRTTKWEGGKEVAAEREFNKSDLAERDGRVSTWRRPELIIDPALIASARAEEAAEVVSRALRADAERALEALVQRFGNDRMRYKTDDEMRAFLAAVGPFVASLETAAQAAG